MIFLKTGFFWEEHGSGLFSRALRARWLCDIEIEKHVLAPSFSLSF